MSEPQLTILHVDDNEANRYVVTRILQNAGFRALEAATGTDGLDAVTQLLPDLVILDVQLPDMSGFEVCRRIKANPATAFIPVLHLSASFVQSQDKAEGLDSGADGYLAQPVAPIELLATVRSLLRIRRAEESALASAQEWQTTFDSINDSVCLLDRDGKFLRCNQATNRLFSQPSQEVLGCAHHDVMQAELGIGDGSCFNRAKATCQRQVLEMQAADRWFAKTIDPVLDEQGAFAGAVFILADITQRKQAEALLQEQNDRLRRLTISLQEQTDQAEQANRIKDEFLAVLSHELRSPLNPILGWARILRTGLQDEARTQYALETIERNAKLQTELIEDLLDISRILRGKLTLNNSPVSLTFTIKAALETVRLAAEAKSIQIQVLLDPDVGQVLGDASRLQQVIWNLLTNAVKFTPQGGQVEVRLEQIKNQEGGSSPSPDRTQFAQITVSDNGKGIAPDFLPHVFDYFRQADSTTTRKFGGLGLGLAIARHLVELHGGTVEVASPGEGQGATFTVRLPILEAAKPDQADDSSHNNHPDFNLNGLPVLLVDDDRDSREFIAFLLGQYGAKVTEADSAIVALNYLTQAEFAVLISDIGMPDIDGYSLMRQIRQAVDPSEQIPAIALTAYAGELDRQQALAAGFRHHISKPIDPVVLIQTILTLAGRYDHADSVKHS